MAPDTKQIRILEPVSQGRWIVKEEGEKHQCGWRTSGKNNESGESNRG